MGRIGPMGVPDSCKSKPAVAAASAERVVSQQYLAGGVGRRTG